MITFISFLLLTAYLFITSAVGNIIGHMFCNALKQYLENKFAIDDDELNSDDYAPFL